MGSGETGSYRIGEARFRDASAELDRLRVQAELAWPQELRALVQHGLREDATVLEAGCGPGFVTALLLEHVRGGSVTGLDLDSTMLAHARELLAGSERVRFVEASASATGLPAESFDVVLARFLLQHLPDVPAVLAELRRVLRPGGRLIVVDSDQAFDALFYPEPPFTGELMRAVAEGQRLLGGDRYIGRRLPALIRDAGFSAIAVDAVVAHSVVVGRRPIRQIIPDQALDHMEADGLVSPELAASARSYLERIDSGEQDFEGMVLYVVVSGSA
ncbi:MAG: class I SAM-dependent methyltransferase [Gaiellaceae bacterium]